MDKLHVSPGAHTPDDVKTHDKGSQELTEAVATLPQLAPFQADVTLGALNFQIIFRFTVCVETESQRPFY